MIVCWQGGDPVTVTIPRDQLKEINRGELIDALEAVNVSISFSHGGAKLRTKLDDFAKANDLVRKTVARLRQFPTAAAPPTVPGQFSSPGQPMTSAATLQRGEGQSADTEYNAGSDRIPSAYLSTQPSSSREFDKNATQYVQQARGRERIVRTRQKVINTKTSNKCSGIHNSLHSSN